MRIAVWHNLPSGGGKRALYDHVSGLLARGHTVESWCPPTADQTYLPLSQIVPEHIVPLAWPPRPSPNPLVRTLRGDWNVVNGLRAMHRHCQRCAEEINRGGYDLLFANSCTLFRVTPIGRYVTLPRVLYLQEPYRWLYEALPRLPWPALPDAGAWWWTPHHMQRRLKDAIMTRGLRIQAREELLGAQAYDVILANSLFSRESMLRAYGLSAHTCYLGIDTAKFVNHGRAREDYVVGIGAFVPEKNVELIIQALGKVREPRPALVWIGNVAKPDYLEALRQLAAALGVAFLPKVRVEDEELVDLLNRATMMVYAPRLEPFGLAPVEANACGLPVIAVAEGGVRETVIDGVTGLLVDHEPTAIASAIEHLLTDRAYARQLGEQGARLVSERWTLAAATDRLERVLNEAADKAATVASSGGVE